MPVQLTDGSGGYADTGVAQESTANEVVESLAHQRNAVPINPISLNTSFSNYYAAWNAVLQGSSPPYAPLVQDYNWVVGIGNGGGSAPSTNPVITGVSYIAGNELWNPGDPNADYPFNGHTINQNMWYDQSGSGSQNATLLWQDWLEPGTYSISFTKTTSHNRTFGTVTFYASAGGVDISLATMDASTSAGAAGGITFHSTTSFGLAIPFRIKAICSGMGGTWVGTWTYGFTDALGNPNTVDSGTNSFPPAGDNWDENNDPNRVPLLPSNNYLLNFNMTDVPGCQFGISGTRTGP